MERKYSETSAGQKEKQQTIIQSRTRLITTIPSVIKVFPNRFLEEINVAAMECVKQLVFTKEAAGIVLMQPMVGF